MPDTPGAGVAPTREQGRYAGPARPSSRALGLLAFGLCGLAWTLWDAADSHPAHVQARAACVQTTAWLGLSDLALLTEAHYTRHPALHEAAGALQDHPLAFDHFPSGSLVIPVAPVRWLADKPSAAGQEPSP